MERKLARDSWKIVWHEKIPHCWLNHVDMSRLAIANNSFCSKSQVKTRQVREEPSNIPWSVLLSRDPPGSTIETPTKKPPPLRQGHTRPLYEVPSVPRAMSIVQLGRPPIQLREISLQARRDPWKGGFDLPNQRTVEVADWTMNPMSKIIEKKFNTKLPIPLFRVRRSLPDAHHDSHCSAKCPNLPR